MKKPLLALSMIATSSLMAQDAPGHYQQNQQSCCDTACAPCCSNPRPCVDCECYVPSFHNLQCDCGFYFDAEFLYWYGNETNTAYAQVWEVSQTVEGAGDTGTDLNLVPYQVLQVGSSWDPGLRLGIGWNTGCDGWDTHLTWTWLRNSKRDTTNLGNIGYSGYADAPALTEGSRAAYIYQGNTTLGFSGYEDDEGNTFYYFNDLALDSVECKWRNILNELDLILGKKFWMSRKFAFRPYGGLRAAWTKTKYRIEGFRDWTYAAEDYTGTIDGGEEFNGRHWSMGIVGGIEPTFYFTDCFAIYTNLGFSVGWGQHKEIAKHGAFIGFWDGIITDPTEEPDETAVDYIDTYTNTHYLMSSIFDTAIGLRWERTWCDCRFRSAFDLGWEHHIWINHSFRSTEHSPSSLISDLGFGGLVVRLRVDF